MRFSLLIFCALALTACGGPRHDGVMWENTYPKGGESIKEIDTLYGKPSNSKIADNGDIIRLYSNWRPKNEANGLTHFGRDHHTVTFHDGKAVSWN